MIPANQLRRRRLVLPNMHERDARFVSRHSGLRSSEMYESFGFISIRTYQQLENNELRDGNWL